MGKNSRIEWCDHTFNGWIGCTKVSPGCDHCYAEGYAVRFGQAQWGVGAERRLTGAETWRQPSRWNAESARRGGRARVFIESLGDFFDNAVPDSLRNDVLQLFALLPNLDPIVLTKRVGIADRFLNENRAAAEFFRSSVMLGVTVVNQEEFDRFVPRLLQLPARGHFVSMEPLLGPVRIGGQIACALDWVILGGESGHGARPIHPEWVRGVRDECARAGTPFFFKQWGEWTPMMGQEEGVSVAGPKFTHPDGTVMGRAGKAAAGRRLDGRLHGAFPDDQVLAQRVVPAAGFCAGEVRQEAVA